MRTWTTDDALPQSTVHAICQTRDGYLWFTTYGGLVRYDGIDFRVFERATTRGIASNRFTTLFEDHSGTLWAGTEDGFLTSLRGGSFRSYHAGRLSNSILAIAETAGTLWVLSNEGFFTLESAALVHRLPQFKTPFGFGYQQGFAYPTSAGVEIVRPELRRTLTMTPSVSSVYTDQHGALWMAQGRQLLRFFRGETRAFALPTEMPQRAFAALLASDDSLWIAIEGKGVARIDGRSGPEWITRDDGLSSTSIDRLFEDREGTIWAGSIDNGISAIRPRIATALGAERGLGNVNVYPVVAEGGTIVAGTWGGGVYRLAHDGFQPIDPAGGWIMSILTEPDGTLWWSSYDRDVTRMKDHQRRRFSTGDGLPNLIVPALYRDRTGHVWAGTYDGLALFDGNRFQQVPIRPDARWREIHVLAEDRDGSLLIGTRAGVGRLRAGKFEIVADERGGLASGNVRSLLVDGDGTIWAGTYDGGLSRIRGGHLATITTREGLFDNGVFSILEQGPFFWMTCNRGIYRVSRADLNAVADGALGSVSALVLTRHDGLESAECNGGVQSAGCKTPDGRLWFPTQRGVVMIDPRLLPSGEPPPVQIAGVRVDGQEAPAVTPLRVGPDGKRIEIDYASMTFLDAAHVRYRTMLEGLDNKWSQIIGARTTSYSSLPAGRYRFLVSAANAAGQWGRPASFDILVAPPFWRTRSFAGLMAILFLTALVSAFWVRLRAIENRRAAQADFSRRLILHQEEERKRVAIELHDSLGQSLLVIKNRALLAVESDADRVAVTRQLGEISETASTAIDEVRRIAYNLRPAELDHLGITKAIDVLLRRVESASPIVVYSQLDPIDGLLSREAEVSVFRIVQEWMSNVVRHSSASVAQVSITSEPPRLRIRIQDDGVGLPGRPELRQGLGMRSISERALMLGGTCEIVSNSGEGTIMTIHLGATRIA